MNEFELQFLAALREQMIAGVMLIDKFMDVPQGSEVVVGGPCVHPEDKRVDASRMGWRGYMCGVCKEIIEQEAS